MAAVEPPWSAGALHCYDTLLQVKLFPVPGVEIECPNVYFITTHTENISINTEKRLVFGLPLFFLSYGSILEYSPKPPHSTDRDILRNSRVSTESLDQPADRK